VVGPMKSENHVALLTLSALEILSTELLSKWASFDSTEW
jgi:hypothetical protein